MIFRFEGNMRAGKTLAMTSWGAYLQYIVRQNLGIYSPIWANYPLHIPFQRFTKWQELKNARNAIILFDEIDTAIDSRNFKSEDQQEMTHLFKQFGKLGNTFMYTSQRDHMVEKRIREQTDYIIKCGKDWRNNRLVQVWIDSQAGQEEEKLVYLRKYIIDNPRLFYKLYDSFAVVETTMVRPKAYGK